MMHGDSSPFGSSPFNSSPRLFWQGRDSGSPFRTSMENTAPYDPEAPIASPKRASIENLKRASRVKNSSMFAREHKQEYDPTHVRVLDRPLATGRAFNQSTSSLEREPSTRLSGQQSNGDQTSPSKGSSPRQPSPTRDQASPGKSSLSKATRFFDPHSQIWSDDRTASQYPTNGQSHHRHAKSVTFDNAPPQVNEYEMTTPDPSSIASESRDGSYDSEEEFAEISFDTDSPYDRVDDSFDASLEDAEKTPVVLPDDWRFMSPASANDELAQSEDDPFMDARGSPGPGSPGPDVRPHSSHSNTSQSRVESLDSNGERRPLPPLPFANNQLGRAGSPRLSAAIERVSSGQRVLPSPPKPASYSKADISEFGRGSMTLEDRLRLMMLQEEGQKNEHTQEDSQHDEMSDGTETPHNEVEGKELVAAKVAGSDEPRRRASFDDVLLPRISRESILRNIKNHDVSLDEPFEYFSASSQRESSPDQYLNFDPDVPIPSLEHDSDDDMETSSVIKQELTDDDYDLYDVPEYNDQQGHEHRAQGESQQTTPDDYDDESQYSRNSEDGAGNGKANSSGSSDGQSTPVPENKPEISVQEPSEASKESSVADNEAESAFHMKDIRESLQRPQTPEAEEKDNSDDEPSTPESVIRHPIDETDSDAESDPESIPDPIATVKAPGTGFKIRPSLTPADTATMAAARRKVSYQEHPMPALTKKVSNGSSQSTEENKNASPPKLGDNIPKLDIGLGAPQRQSSLVKLDIPVTGNDDSLFGLDKEFDRVIEAQKVAFELSLSQSLYSIPPSCTQDSHACDTLEPKDTEYNSLTPLHEHLANKSSPRQRGYLMRQNTKVIIASSRNEEESAPNPEQRGTKPASSSPRKASQPTWTTEPWQGQRRQSIKLAGTPGKKKPGSGPVPPLPGQASNVQEAALAVEELENNGLNETLEEGEERGRLFVKVVGIKDLDMPLPRGERSYFALTLDNGLHCVTTAWLELGKSAPIGQEFELIVQNDLEFQLTLQMKVDEAKLYPQEHVPATPTKQKTSTFSRVFASPKKRKEMELKQQLEAQQRQKAESRAGSGAWEKLRTVIARDGSFGRAYVCLSDHEKHAFGRPYGVDVACFNEWAVEESSSVKSKKSSSSSGSQRKPPYKIGNLELQLLFVPKPKGAKDEDMPKSMNACIREMREAENTAARSYEGFLSQQGGDCPYWRRRFFRLQGSKLTAYHETTRQPRATINLAKAAKLIDDKSSLTQKETSTKGGGRRKSAFAEEEEGYMFVEEGFRIRFANGEVIDFYADSASDKEAWMRVLAETVGKGQSAGNGPTKAWTELVLKREKSLSMRRDAERHLSSGAPAPPKKDNIKPVTSKAPAPPPPQRRHQHTLSSPEARNPDVRRQKTRSLIW
ncbi:GTP binding protein (Bud4), putative [Paecilomyces variotii No. 5]|uniref:GTP binding protein (Bud4), putative n=1 Tax=Byssochlamys spectabilis (strain No. 5 / NBRC 109023) TaxID=1356009 RepID=V5FA11_BYSSN|nr:GTP binding protein (Bud4), putative [Paecilomyces variotii No. 5]